MTKPTDLNTFTFIDEVDIPMSAVRESGVVVNDIDWDVVNHDHAEPHNGIARTRLAEAGVEDPEEWMLVAYRHENQTSYDEFEGKWEYAHEILYIVVPMDVVAEWSTDYGFDDVASDYGYVEYAA